MTRAPRVAAYGFLGMGNLGNEASFEAVLRWLRASHPEAEVVCLSAGPADVLHRHGVPGTTLMSYRPAPGAAGLAVAARKAFARLVDVPRTFALVRRADVVIVPGMGVLEASLGANRWGLPFWQFLAALGCRLQRRALVLLSVGAEVPDDPVVRRFYRWTVALARYTTYRDEGSRAAMASLGGAGRPATVQPDLAFALPAPTPQAVPGHVVMGVMAYPGAHGEGGTAAVDAYVGRLVEALTRLLDGGHTVSLVVGDTADFAVAERLADEVAAQRPEAGGRVVVSRADTMAALMGEMARAEVVVASRFHNVIAALKVACPVVSLGYAAKNRHLLEEFGMGDLAQPITDFDVDLLLDHVARALDRRAELVPRMAAVLDDYAVRLTRQFAEVTQQVIPPGAGPR